MIFLNNEVFPLPMFPTKPTFSPSIISIFIFFKILTSLISKLSSFNFISPVVSDTALKSLVFSSRDSICINSSIFLKADKAWFSLVNKDPACTKGDKTLPERITQAINAPDVISKDPTKTTP